jgi:hypothetical protein
MSLFSAPTTSTSTFNSSDLAGNGDVQTISINLGDYVTKSTPVMTNSLYLKENVGINFFGKKQETAYTEIDRTKLNDSASAIVAIKNNNNITTIDETLDLQNTNLLLSDESIAISKIMSLTTKLLEIDANLLSINSNDNDIEGIENIVIQHTTDLSDISQTNTEQTNLLTQHSSNISDNADSIQLHINNLALHNNRLDNHDLSLNSIKADLIVKTGLVSDLFNEDVTIHSEIDANLLSLNNYKVSTNASIDNIDTNIVNHSSNLVNIESDITNIQVKDIGQDADILNLQNLSTQHGLSIDGIVFQNTSQDTSLNTVFTNSLSNKTDITSLQGLTTSNLNRLSSLETTSTSHTTNLTQIETDVLTKHAIINNANKLNVSFLGNGDITNNKLSTLNDININESIQTQINNISSELSILDGF